MTVYTVDELCLYLWHLAEDGYGDFKVRVSVSYDNCEHIQDLQQIHCFDDENRGVYSIIRGGLND